MNGRKTRRRAQMEILGIAIVVIIMLVGLALLLTLSIKPPQKQHELFSRRQLSQNLMLSIVKSNTDCAGHTFSTVLSDCANRGPDGSINCGEVDGIPEFSCKYAERNIRTILDEVLGTMRYEYMFTAKIDGGRTVVPEIETGRCNSDNIDHGLVDVESPGFQPFPIEAGTLEMMLSICT